MLGRVHFGDLGAAAKAPAQGGQPCLRQTKTKHQGVREKIRNKGKTNMVLPEKQEYIGKKTWFYLYINDWKNNSFPVFFLLEYFSMASEKSSLK